MTAPAVGAVVTIDRGLVRYRVLDVYTLSGTLIAVLRALPGGSTGVRHAATSRLTVHEEVAA